LVRGGTSPADPRTIPPDVRVLSREWVPLIAVCTPSVSRGQGRATESVLPDGHRLEVVGIDAPAVRAIIPTRALAQGARVAGVVQGRAIWNGAVAEFVDEPMGSNELAVVLDLGIATLGGRTEPQPAIAIGLGVL